MACALNVQGLCVFVAGNTAAPLLFFSPGAAGQPLAVDFTVPFQADFLVAWYDPCGVGASLGCPLRPTWTKLVQDADVALSATLRAYGRTWFAAAGWSGGCFLAIRLAEQRADRLFFTLLISPVVDFPRAEPHTWRCLSRRMRWPVALVQRVPDAIQRFWQYMLCGNFCAQTSPLVAIHRCAHFPQSDLSTLWRASLQRNRVVREYKQQRLLAALNDTPVVVLHGIHDEIAPYVHVRDISYLRWALQTTRLHTFAAPNASHFVRYESPSAVQQTVRRCAQITLPCLGRQHNYSINETKLGLRSVARSATGAHARNDSITSATDGNICNPTPYVHAQADG